MGGSGPTSGLRCEEAREELYPRLWGLRVVCVLRNTWQPAVKVNGPNGAALGRCCRAISDRIVIGARGFGPGRCWTQKSNAEANN
jgi:hypothetical protein